MVNDMATGIFNGLANTINRVVEVTRAEAPKKVSESVVQSPIRNDDVKDETEAKPLSTEQLASTVKGLNNLVQVQNRALEFSVDEDSGKTVITVVDSETDMVIRQIPSAEALELAQRMQELQSGLIKTQV